MERLRDGAMAVEAVTAALIELEVMAQWIFVFHLILFLFSNIGPY